MERSESVHWSTAALITSLAMGGGIAGGAALNATSAQADETDNTPVVRLTDDGVAYQLSPSESNDAYEGLDIDPLPYNTYWLQSDERGCESCHTNLEELVQTVHAEAQVDVTGILSQMTVSQCGYCHDVDGSATEFANTIHALHGVGTANALADCRSCHDGDGGTALWDEVKFDRMSGFTEVAAEDLAATIMLEWDQERTVDTDDFVTAALQGTLVAQSNVSADDWTISVAGAVNNAATYRLADLIQLGLPVTQMICIESADNPVGGGLIGQVEVTGIPLSSIMLMAGVQPDAQAFSFTTADGSQCDPISLATLDNGANVLFVYEINGQPVSELSGGAVWAMVGGQDSAHSFVQVNGVSFLSTAADAISAHGANTPNVGELDTREGQIITAGQPYTFSGYAYAFDEPVTAIEISMDHGQSWVRYDLQDTDFNRWVSWRFTFTPEDGVDTAYVLSVRSITGTDTQSEPIQVFVNAKTPENVAAAIAAASGAEVEQPLADEPADAEAPAEAVETDTGEQAEQYIAEESEPTEPQTDEKPDLGKKDEAQKTEATAKANAASDAEASDDAQAGTTFTAMIKTFKTLKTTKMGKA